MLLYLYLCFSKTKSCFCGKNFVLFFWSGPIAIGIFLVSLGTMIYLLSKADAIRKGVGKKEKEKK
ncbi:hypothetical protein CEE34_03755 [Candidatus Aerophobetes bacterium Ae_b3a]|nr:MAG: hypothetical protein CEE34_03755 [Candidatus Aerophobetes bacterium Ae_b3a]